MDELLLTIKYFDLFDYPLSREELWQWLFYNKTERSTQHQSPMSRDEYERELDRLLSLSKIEKRDYYYFLPGRDDIVRSRKAREVISLAKIKKAQWIGRLLGLVGGLKMIALVSNLGYLNADEEADIDMFIVSQRGKLWGVRFWCVVLMKILNQRPRGKKMKNKICLSYFVDEDNLNLESTKLAEPDVHLVYLVSQTLPIYSEDGMWDRYRQANQWLANYLPNFRYLAQASRFMIKPRFRWLKELIDKTAFGFEEKLYKFIQLKKMARELKAMMNKSDKKVIVNNGMLKLHTNDKREEINSKILNE